MLPIQPCLLAGLIAVTFLSACGGDTVVVADPMARAEILTRSERGMQAVTMDASHSYVSLTNTATEGSAVMRAARRLDAGSAWQPVALGACALPTNAAVESRRAPQLKQVGGKTLLMQPAWGGPEEHTLCALDGAGARFTPIDKDFKICYQNYCDTMAVEDVQAVGQRWFANAGGAPNLQVSTDQGASWRPVMGSMDSMACTHQSFHLTGGRLLTGGECPLDMAYVRAYPMLADYAALASTTALPLSLPELENRNVHVIASQPNSERVFVGVEGALLRSDDGGRTFKFVMRQPIEGGAGYPYVTHLLFPSGKRNAVVAAGFDKARGLPYLAWSADAGSTWIDLSSLLPGYRPGIKDGTSQVTSLAEDGQGRLLVTVNEEYQAKGRLVAVTLGKL